MEFLSKLGGHSPVLEAVEFQSNFSEGRDYDEYDENCLREWNRAPSLPPLFRDAPNLTFLRASKLPFSQCFLEFHHLTHLELSYIPVSSSDCLAVISANPMLEIIILRRISNWEEEAHIQEIVPTSLHHLRRLELYGLFVEQILWGLSFPPGTHFSCVCPNGYFIPPSNALENIATVERLQFTLSKNRKGVSRVVSGSGSNGTFLLSDTLPQLDLDIREILLSPLNSLEELSISFVEVWDGESNSSLTFADPRGSRLGLFLYFFARLRVLTLRRVNGCETILALLRNPRVCPRLHTMVLANIRSHATYWPSLVEMARVREQDTDSSSISRVDVGCRAGEWPASDQLAELRTYVFSVEVKPWDYEIEELDWLKDPRFSNLGRL